MMANKEPIYDLSQLRAISRGNELFIRKMVDIFCEQTPVSLGQMEEAFHLNDLEKMGGIAHRIKPSIDNLNIIQLKPIIRMIEHIGKEKVATIDLAETLIETREILTMVIDALRKDYPVNDK